jgi:hypothetical protein
MKSVELFLFFFRDVDWMTEERASKVLIFVTLLSLICISTYVLLFSGVLERKVIIVVAKRTVPPLPPPPPPPPPPSLAVAAWNFSKPPLSFPPGEACFLVSTPHYTQCVRRTPDVVSSEIRVQKRWRGCDSPVQFQRDSGNQGIFLDVGANIGSCSLAALAAGATVIAFEPLPSNLYYFSPFHEQCSAFLSIPVDALSRGTGFPAEKRNHLH